MTQKTANIIYIVLLIVILTLGVVILFDDVYFLITGERLGNEDSVAEEKPDIPRITTEELEQKVYGEEDFLLIDVRTEEEYQAGHIPDAANIPLDTIDDQIGKIGLVKNFEIVTVCDNEGCNRADQAATKLIGLGFENVKSYSDGVYAWEDAGNELVTGLLNAENFIGLFKDFQTQELVVSEASNKIFQEDAIVIDVQEREKYDQEHLEDAIYLELNNAAARSADGSLPKDRAIVIYSEDGVRGKIAVGAFLENGYDYVWNMQGGIEAWKASGLEVTAN